MNYKENEIISVDEQSLESVEDVDSYIKGAVDGAELKTSIDWKQKLSSRKLWTALVGVIVGLVEASVTIVLACYFDNSKKEKIARAQYGSCQTGEQIQKDFNRRTP